MEIKHHGKILKIRGIYDGLEMARQLPRCGKIDLEFSLKKIGWSIEDSFQQSVNS